jgi:hypothetical protein
MPDASGADAVRFFVIPAEAATSPGERLGAMSR